MAYIPNFRIETSRTETYRTIALLGELDGGAALALAAAFELAMSSCDFATLILDMRQLSFIDSAGMRAIIEVERAADDGTVNLEVVPAPDCVTELLRGVGLGARFGVGPSPDLGADGDYLERIDLTLNPDPAAPGRARAELAQVAPHLSEADASIAKLLISELVTNAVIHPSLSSHAPIALRIVTAESRLRVEVTDAGAGFDPASPEPREADRGGRGLPLVDRLASRWGAGPCAGQEGRFCVWFELDLTSERDPVTV
jgi:anti-anti-sigma factor